MNSFDYDTKGIIQFGTIPTIVPSDMVVIFPLSLIAKPGQPMAINGDLTVRNRDTLVIELSKADEGKMGPAPTTPTNKEVEEVDQQLDQPKITILFPKELKDQGTVVEKPVKVIFERPTHKMA